MLDWYGKGCTIYDVIIVGAGINGCALARLAALNGLKVALIEKNDFGCGVTSRSTRLIHGGLRYLESFRFHLVKESLHDRRILLREFPGQVQPRSFLIPVYKRDARPLWYVSIGLTMYSFLAGGTVLPKHRRLSADQVRAEEPGLDTEGLLGGFVYYDCQAVYPERLSLEMALQAEEAGATVRNHTAVKGFLMNQGRVVGVRVDGPGGERELRSRLVVNAGGAWADRVRRLLPNTRTEPLLTLLNGTHIVVRPFEGAPRNAIYHGARLDGRPFFIIPWRGLYLIGTTETTFDGDPDRMAPTDSEIEYLLTEVNAMFPRAGISRESILYSYCGSRPLLRVTGGSMNSASRDHSIYDHETEEGVGGMLTLVGGKLTTARSFAWETLRRIAHKLGGKPPADPGVPAPIDLNGVPARLAMIYGPRAARLQEYLAERPDSARPLVEGCGTTRGEVLFAIEHEKASSLADILLRRTGMAFDADYQPEWARRTAAFAAEALGWDAAETARAVAAYEDELAATLVAASRPAYLAT